MFISSLTAECFDRVHGNPIHKNVRTDNAADNLFDDGFSRWWFNNNCFAGCLIEFCLQKDNENFNFNCETI